MKWYEAILNSGFVDSVNEFHRLKKNEYASYHDEGNESCDGELFDQYEQRNKYTGGDGDIQENI